MPKVVFNCHVLGVPNGGGATHTYNKGTVIHLSDAEYALLEGRRMRDGTRWIRITDMKTRSVKLIPKSHREPKEKPPPIRRKHKPTDPVTGRKIEPAIKPEKKSMGAFYCEHKGCEKSFTTKQGFGVHKGRAHGGKDAHRSL